MNQRFTAAIVLFGLAMVFFVFDCVPDVSDGDHNGDDTGGEVTCDDVYTQMYDECGWTFYDENGNEIPVEDVIGACEAGDATLLPQSLGLDGPLSACILDYWDDCDEMLDCLSEVFD
jgi:hypothetical protein